MRRRSIRNVPLLNMKINLTAIERRVAKKLISKQELDDLIIYNYTEKCQFDKTNWDKYTMMCRGLIVKKDGTIVARPFPKFFNMGETGKTDIKNLPSYQPEVTEKLDGSLGILYPTKNGWAVSTRGSFESEQAIWATKWLNQKKKGLEVLENHSYLFEIIYPFNRIVVNYGNRAELVLLGLVHNWTGKIMPYSLVKSEAERLGFSYPKLHTKSIAEIEEEAKTSVENEEGFVIFYPSENLQIKVKLTDYVRLHRLTFGVSVKSIWENMMYGQDVYTLMKDAPDEVYNWIKTWAKHFDNKASFIETEAKKHYDIIKNYGSRKEQALYLQAKAHQYLPIVFAMIDKKDYRQRVFKLIQPKPEDSNKSYKVVRTGDL